MIFIKFQSYPIPKECPYCNSEVVLTTNDELYGRKFFNVNGNCNIYLCFACMASVGTHGDGVTPLGRIANRELKAMKKEAHALFDPLWQSGKMPRYKAYKWLAERLKIPTRECHFGWFDKPQLEKAITILKRAAARRTS